MPARKELDMNTFEGIIASRLLNLRCSAGLTQKQAAEKIGVSEGVVFKWENGQSQPPLHRLPMIAKAYGVSIKDLIPENF